MELAMNVDLRGTYQIVPFGTMRAVIVIPSLATGDGSLHVGGDNARVLRGNTADEAVTSISLADEPSGDKE
jgi:hypothetical protein